MDVLISSFWFHFPGPIDRPSIKSYNPSENKNEYKGFFRQGLKTGVKNMNENTLDGTARNTMSFLVRILGFFLLLAGLWVALQVLLTAQDLYEHPEKIERFAVAIEKGSNIDKTLAPIRDSLIAQSDSGNDSGNGVQQYTENEKRPATVGTGNIRVSYFFAWVIALLLLLLIARISLAAIKTGGELVLFDMQIKQFARMLAKESQKIRD